MIGAQNVQSCFTSTSAGRKKCRLSAGPLRLLGGERIDTPLAVSECFAEAFSSVFVAETPPAPAPNQIYDGHMTMVSVCETDVVTVLPNLDVSSAVGRSPTPPPGRQSRSERSAAAVIYIHIYITVRHILSLHN